MANKVQAFMNKVIAKDPSQREFHQAVREVMESVFPVLHRHPEIIDARICERIVEPERVIMFRVPWMDDRNNVHVNRGYRVEMNSAIGPYKGGLRFHPSVNLGVLKFLGFEQTFKNALTTLPMGGGKGGSDFDPRGKSDHEIMRFCQSFMTELSRHIGPNTDVPAGDIGVGGREIGYLFGQYKRLKNEFTGVLTGKGRNWGGSLIRPEATGYGVSYFAEAMLNKQLDMSLKDSTVAISGFGNVAWGVAEKVAEMGGKVVTLSGPDGFIYDPEGIVTREKIEFMLEMRASGMDRVSQYSDKFGCEFHAGKRPWGVKCDVAIPCAIENELNATNAQELIDNGCKAVVEAANMPTTADAMHLLQKHMLFAPGKAANAGGVGVSGLEMSQNSLRLSWTRKEVDQRLFNIMNAIHKSCYDTAAELGQPKNMVLGANVAGFLKVAYSMLDQGLV